MTGHWPLPLVFWLKMVGSFAIGAALALLLAALLIAAVNAKPSKARDRALIRCMVPFETIKSRALRDWCLKQSDKMP